MTVAVIDHALDRRATLAKEIILSMDGTRLAVEPYDSYEVFQNRFLGADIIFLSVDSMHDVEAGHKLAQLFSHIPLVVVSDSDEYSVEAFALGARDYLVRPLSKGALQTVFLRCQLPFSPAHPPNP